MKNTLLLLALLISCTAQTQTMEHIFSADQLPWRIVNDGVMGGLSTSQMSDTEEGYARFAGSVSLENNGGFASTRVDVPEEVQEGTKKVGVRVKGDGKRYSLRLLPKGAFSQVSYRVFFDTKEGEWQEFTFELPEFIATFRGRILEDVPPITDQSLRELSILIADKQVGAFELLIDWVGMD